MARSLTGHRYSNTRSINCILFRCVTEIDCIHTGLQISKRVGAIRSSGPCCHPGPGCVSDFKKATGNWGICLLYMCFDQNKGLCMICEVYYSKFPLLNSHSLGRLYHYISGWHTNLFYNIVAIIKIGNEDTAIAACGIFTYDIAVHLCNAELRIRQTLPCRCIRRCDLQTGLACRGK